MVKLSDGLPAPTVRHLMDGSQSLLDDHARSHNQRLPSCKLYQKMSSPMTPRSSALAMKRLRLLPRPASRNRPFDVEKQGAPNRRPSNNGRFCSIAAAPQRTAAVTILARAVPSCRAGYPAAIDRRSRRDGETPICWLIAAENRTARGRDTKSAAERRPSVEHKVFATEHTRHSLLSPAS